jgi:hypothetical protein
MAGSAGVVDYVKNYPAAFSYPKGDDTFAAYGLPQTLFGLGGVVVDDTVRVTTRKGNSSPARGFFYGDATSLPAWCS